jgi:Tfp pilus assembly protein PilO
MNFKKLPKDKRNHLILVFLATALAIAGLGFGLIRRQYQNLNELAREKVAAQSKVRQMEDTVKQADQLKAKLAEAAKTLSELESGMASGDLYSWAIDTINKFKLPYKVEIPLLSQPSVGEVNLLPKFPYKQTMLTVNGTAYFHDFGKFLADFENQFPQIRVLNLELEPAASLILSEKEKLSFKMDIVALVKPNP